MIQKDLPPEPTPRPDDSDPKTIHVLHRNASSGLVEEFPPPYSRDPGSRGRNASFTVGDRRIPHASNDFEAQRGSVNKIALHTQHQNIVGTFHVDPDLHVEDSYLLKKSCKSRNKRRMKDATPNASFHTKRGAIDLNLVITGRPNGVSKAYVQLSNRTGDIAVNLLSLQATKHVNLDCHSKRGNIVVLLPKTYCGAIQVRTRKGNIKFLPAFTSMMRVVNAKDDEALILLGDTNAPVVGSEPSAAIADYCQLVSRKGNITVGLSGVDSYVQESGIWKRLGELIWGVKPTVSS